ncbi:hypothetical protein ACS5UA_17115 [Brucella sp. RRSP16]|nr:hypothetical protein [Brucella intermedia]
MRRNVSLEDMAKLRPAFSKNGTVTAAMHRVSTMARQLWFLWRRGR